MVTTQSQQPAEQTKPFSVKDCALVALATGRKARLLQELKSDLSDVDAASIYHHFRGGLLQPRFEEREYNNDFAAWARHGIHDAVLAERLAALNPTRFPDLEALRSEIIAQIEIRLDETELLFWTRATHQFEFICSQIVVFDTGRRLSGPAELPSALTEMSTSSIFYHFIDARRRTPDGGDDFSDWLATWGEGFADLREQLMNIDPYFGSLSELRDKHVDLEPRAIEHICEQYQLDPQRPLLVQVSRFDRFKDPVGVIQAYRLAKQFVPSLQLVLAGGGAADDPEDEAVLSETRAAAQGDENIHILLLPADAHRDINALQRAADIVLQKSVREGFGLTVTEAMWKGKPVIGGDAGGIRLQVINHHTGFLVSTPEGAALRIRYLLHQPEKIDEIGRKARKFVRENFLITRHLREFLTLMLALTSGAKERIELA
jgi:glycosyltransferase involved in cell wall biosynthesis